MSSESNSGPAIPRRRAVGPPWEWVRRRTAPGGLPCEITPVGQGIDLEGWTTSVRGEIDALLLQVGALLFRGFGVETIEQFEAFIRSTTSGPMLDYSYRSTPRTRVHDRIYTSTEYPPGEAIPLHNEMSYARRWPLKIWFFCDRPAEDGGYTPIADSRRVFEEIPPEVRDRFLRRQVRYVRNYGGALDLSAEEVFGEATREGLEARCRSEGLDWAWTADGKLRTWQVCQAAAIHPRTGEQVWFNQAHLFHPSSLRDDARTALLAILREDELPRNVCYGDGMAIDPADLDHIRGAYDRTAVPIHWRKGDVLLLDNMLVAHGRSPFSGSRRVLVGMAEPYSPDKVHRAGA